MTTNNQLKALIERIEKLEEEKAALAQDVKDVFAEAKSSGFDTKIMKQVIALRKKDAAKRAEEQAILSTYMEALGMLAGTPLGDAAVRSAQIRQATSKPAGKVSQPVIVIEEEEDDEDF